MFGMFNPRCPLNIREKTWIELRMQWLVDRLSFDRLASVEILTPSDAHFPEAYSGSDEQIERVFSFLCRQVGVLRDSVDFQVFAGVRPSLYIYDSRNTALGLYEPRSDDSSRQTVWVERSQTADLAHLIATAAHELAHCVLLGNRLLTDAEGDHEFVTDLATVFFGLGIFAANAAIVEENRVVLGGGTWRSVAKTGYLPNRMFGYALAVLAWLRDEEPSWGRYLSGDPRNAFKEGLAYLQKTGDCLCHAPRRMAREIPDRLAVRLASDNAGERLGALWELRRPDPAILTADEWTAVIDCLGHREPIVIAEAALAIAALRRPDPRVVKRSLDLLWRFDDSPDLLSAVTLALSTQQAVFAADSEQKQAAVDLLFRLSESNSQRVVIAALTGIRQLAPTCDFLALKQLMQLFRQGLLACENLLVMHVVQTLRVVCADPEQEMTAFFPDDVELRGLARAALTAEFDEAELTSVLLRTVASLPVPLPDWHPTPIRLPSEPEAQDSAP